MVRVVLRLFFLNLIVLSMAFVWVFCSGLTISYCRPLICFVLFFQRHVVI